MLFCFSPRLDTKFGRELGPIIRNAIPQMTLGRGSPMTAALGRVRANLYRKLHFLVERGNIAAVIQIWSQGQGSSVSPDAPAMGVTEAVRRKRDELLHQLQRSWQRRSSSAPDLNPFLNGQELAQAVNAEENFDRATEKLTAGGNTALFPYTEDLHVARMCTANFRLDQLDEKLLDAPSAFQLSVGGLFERFFQRLFP